MHGDSLCTGSVTDHSSHADWSFRPTCPNILVPLAAHSCLSEKRISVKYEETVTDSMGL